MKQSRVTVQLVEYIPEHLQEGVLYISQKYGTVAHNCCCGCREEVVTPIGPTDWSLTIDGKLATLYPSIGNWSFECRSHYWIRRSEVIWAAPMSQWQINRGRALDRANKDAYFRTKNQQESVSSPTKETARSVRSQSPSIFTMLWQTLKDWLK